MDAHAICNFMVFNLVSADQLKLQESLFITKTSK